MRVASGLDKVSKNINIYCQLQITFTQKTLLIAIKKKVKLVLDSEPMFKVVTGSKVCCAR